MNYKCRLHGTHYKDGCFECSLIQEIKTDFEAVMKKINGFDDGIRRIEALESRPWWKMWGKRKTTKEGTNNEQ